MDGRFALRRLRTNRTDVHRAGRGAGRQGACEEVTRDPACPCSRELGWLLAVVLMVPVVALLLGCWFCVGPHTMILVFRPRTRPERTIPAFILFFVALSCHPQHRFHSLQTNSFSMYGLRVATPPLDEPSVCRPCSLRCCLRVCGVRVGVLRAGSEKRKFPLRADKVSYT